ncbi:PREDICTED: beta carbonic anhydrase 5, chloroplastic-like isoform X2 [Lupinus angustifolius]|uniref:beta carbonic anhydrase 5, chloroplastic-like isoform X2 n=1 Tax=Lupinus angustifolius TaxID=3871 RepID=UPI00092E9FC2|nr:PREDICTED: beta carbonic anhydrase 5, chloroplastic-like isoform X2 [Lupinus angustifolius]
MVWPIIGYRMCSLLRSKVQSMGSFIHREPVWCLPFSGLTSTSVVSSRTRPLTKMSWTKPYCGHAATSSFKEQQPEDSSNCHRLSPENKDLDVGNMAETDGNQDLFDLMKKRFLSFKKHAYIKELEHFQALAEAQSPKFLVIACADSRVCPSNILGFQPGDAFMIRNIANLIPAMKNGPSECNAALEFAVTTLQVENIFVIGHSRCAGIETLMNMQDVQSRNFIHKWVANGEVAKLRTKAATAHLSFDQQCRFCEKESINQSLVNMLSYPWIEDRVRRELLSLHGGYYNFKNCSFEKWTLDFKECNVTEEGRSYAVKEQEFWG